LAGRAKDIAAGGVLLAALTAVAVAGWILLIPLYQWMQ
jgi:diacylglycerol kinase